MNAWLTQRSDRQYWCLSRGKPVIGPLSGTDDVTASPPALDAINWPGVCDVTIEQLLPAVHKRAEPLRPNRIAMAYLSHEHPEESARDFVEEIGPPLRQALLAVLQDTHTETR